VPFAKTTANPANGAPAREVFTDTSVAD
jgi:hypothetical protein